MDVSFKGHASRFMNAVGAVVDNLQNLEETLTPLLVGLGENHVHFQVRGGEGRGGEGRGGEMERGEGGRGGRGGRGGEGRRAADCRARQGRNRGVRGTIE